VSGFHPRRDGMLVENMNSGWIPSQSQYVKGFGVAAVQTLINLAAMKNFAELFNLKL
jgi:hypothetical protein